MTREDKLYSMTMNMLMKEAEKLNVKINKKGKKADAVAKLLKAEEELKKELLAEAEAVAAEESTLSVPMPTESGENGPQLIEKKVEKKERHYKVDPNRDAFVEAVMDLDADTSMFQLKTWEHRPNLVTIYVGKKVIGEVGFAKKRWRLTIKAEVADELGFKYDELPNGKASIKNLSYEDADTIDRFLEYMAQ